MPPRPKLSINALKARLAAEPAQLFVLVEGDADQHLLRRALGDQDHNIDCYRVDEVDIKILDEFRQYGGHKGRVASVARELAAEGEPQNFLGIVDRDVDGLIRPVLREAGLIYTEFATMPSCIFTKDGISRVIANSFGLDLSDDFLGEVLKFSVRYYFLFAYKEKFYQGTSLPSFSRDVRKIHDGGFDWMRYLAKVRNQIHYLCLPLQLNLFLDEIERAKDCRVNLRDHDASAYLHALLCKELGLRNVSEAEVWRHLLAEIIRSRACPEFAKITARAALIARH